MTVLRQLRIRRALGFLKVGHLSIGEVAVSVGYSGRASFIRSVSKVKATDPHLHAEALRYLRERADYASPKTAKSPSSSVQTR
jgi:transcriptional regulator GlxA family with amidase domain